MVARVFALRNDFCFRAPLMGYNAVAAPLWVAAVYVLNLIYSLISLVSRATTRIYES